MGTTDFRISNSVFSAKVFSISPGYWKAAGTHMVAGRDFTLARQRQGAEGGHRKRELRAPNVWKPASPRTALYVWTGSLRNCRHWAPEIVTEVSRTLAKIDPNVPFTFQSWPEALAFVLFPARVGLVATWIPAQRALRVHLAGLLREE